MKSKAKVFEQEVRIGLRKAFPQHLIYHETDFPFFAVQKGNTRFIHSKAVDFLVLGRQQSFAIEVKFTQQNSFAFQNVEPSQLKFLNEFQKKVGKSYLVLGSLYPGMEASFISLTDYKSLIESIQKQSINFKNDMNEYGHYFTGLPRIQMRKNFYVDFTPLTTIFRLY